MVKFISPAQISSMNSTSIYPIAYSTFHLDTSRQLKFSLFEVEPLFLSKPVPCPASLLWSMVPPSYLLKPKLQSLFISPFLILHLYSISKFYWLYLQKFNNIQSPTYDGQTYNFSTSQWCESSMHSVETIFWILIFSPS